MKGDSKTTIVIATGNGGKAREIREMLRSVPVPLRDLTDFPHIAEVPETGSTFVENARLKALGYAAATGLRSLADDSGLEVAALDGRPGVLSARYGGDGLGFAEKIELLLGEMAESGGGDRGARFVCSMVLADENGNVLTEAEGECRGTIAPLPRGSGGFGYDPIFIPEGYERTFAELPDAVKGEISHRARAAEKIMRYLLDFTGV